MAAGEAELGITAYAGPPRPGFDAVVVDQVAAPVPFIRAFSSSKARRRVLASPRQCSCQLTAAPATTLSASAKPRAAQPTAAETAAAEPAASTTSTS